MSHIFQFPATAASPLAHARAVIRDANVTDAEFDSAAAYLSVHGDYIDQQTLDSMAYAPKPAPVRDDGFRDLTPAEIEEIWPTPRKADRLPKLNYPEPDVGRVHPLPVPLVMVTGVLTISLAVYGAARLIPDLVEAHPWLIGWLDALASLF